MCLIPSLNLRSEPGRIALLVLLISASLAFAADKNGVSPSAISLPKGPGSIEGLGESFQPTLNTGTAGYGIGLSLPPGTAGQQPALKLHYEGGEGNGVLGYGWSLSLPMIQRRSDKGSHSMKHGHQTVDGLLPLIVTRTGGRQYANPGRDGQAGGVQTCALQTQLGTLRVRPSQFSLGIRPESWRYFLQTTDRR